MAFAGLGAGEPHAASEVSGPVSGGDDGVLLEFLELPFDEQAGQSVRSDEFLSGDAERFAEPHAGDEQEPPDEPPFRVGFQGDEPCRLSGGEDGDFDGFGFRDFGEGGGVPVDEPFGHGVAQGGFEDAVGQACGRGRTGVGPGASVAAQDAVLDHADVAGAQPVERDGADDGRDVHADAGAVAFRGVRGASGFDDLVHPVVHPFGEGGVPAGGHAHVRSQGLVPGLAQRLAFGPARGAHASSRPVAGVGGRFDEGPVFPVGESGDSARAFLASVCGRRHVTFPWVRRCSRSFGPRYAFPTGIGANRVPISAENSRIWPHLVRWQFGWWKPGTVGIKPFPNDSKDFAIHPLYPSSDNVRYVRLVIEKTLRLAGVASPSATEGDSTHVVSTLSQRRWKLPPAGAISQCISKYRFTASSRCSGCSMIS